MELGDEKAVNVVRVWVVAACELERGVEGLAAEAGETLAAKGEVGLDELDVGALGEGVCDDLFVFLDGDGAEEGKLERC